MKKLSLRIRLLLLFTGISCLIWICSGLFSWFESREKIDEFFDQYQILLARQLASADWSGLPPTVRRLPTALSAALTMPTEEDEAIGFAVFDRAGKMIFHDNENGKDFIFSPAPAVSSTRTWMMRSGALSGSIPRTKTTS